MTMSDTPPPELVDHIARLGIPASERRPDALDRQRAWNMLQALAGWADGGLIDPRNWRRFDVETVGVDYCRAHHGIRSEDEVYCDFLDDDSACDFVPLCALTCSDSEEDR